MKISKDTGKWCDVDLKGTCSKPLETCNDIKHLAVANYCNNGNTVLECGCNKVCCAPFQCHSWDYIDNHLNIVNGGIHLEG